MADQRRAASLAPYPPKELADGESSPVYRSQFVVTEDDARLVTSLFATHVNDGNFTTRHAARPEFGGYVIELMTNSVTLLQALDALHLSPPAPWIAFPYLDASAIGSLQGSLDYWWTWLWMPYWDSATSGERQALLAQASDEWREFFEFHA